MLKLSSPHIEGVRSDEQDGFAAGRGSKEEEDDGKGEEGGFIQERDDAMVAGGDGGSKEAEANGGAVSLGEAQAELRAPSTVA